MVGNIMYKVSFINTKFALERVDDDGSDRGKRYEARNEDDSARNVREDDEQQSYNIMLLFEIVMLESKR